MNLSEIKDSTAAAVKPHAQLDPEATPLGQPAGCRRYAAVRLPLPIPLAKDISGQDKSSHRLLRAKSCSKYRKAAISRSRGSWGFEVS